MSRSSRRSVSPPRGWLTLLVTFLFVGVFRLEQNAAYVLGISTQQLVALDVFAVEAVTRIIAPLLHAHAGHLVSTLVWFIPFGYFLERRTRWEDYVGFVVLAGVLSTTLVPAAVTVSGLASGIALGASGITHALVGREAIARLTWLVEGRSLSLLQWTILVVAVLGLLLKLLSFASSPPPDTSLVGHATGLVVGTIAGLGERHVAISDSGEGG